MRMGTEDETKKQVPEFEVDILFGGYYDRCTTYFELRY